MKADCSRQSDYCAIELLSAPLYVVGMVRILLMFALVMSLSLKHFERAPAYASATTDIFAELTLAAGVSAVVVKAPDCNDKYNIAGNLLQSHKSDCKAVIGKVAGSSSAAVDDHLLGYNTSTVAAIRPVDLPPPRA